MSSPEFFKHASCRGLNPSMFYLDLGDPGITTAIEVCKECPVRMECLVYAIESQETDFGIWGGVAPRARRPSRAKATIAKVQNEIEVREQIALAAESRKRAAQLAYQNAR